MTDREAVRLALYDAIEWQRGLVRAHAHMKESDGYKDAVAAVKRYKAVLRRRYGTDRNLAQERLDRLPTITLSELMGQKS